MTDLEYGPSKPIEQPGPNWTARALAALLALSWITFATIWTYDDDQPPSTATLTVKGTSPQDPFRNWPAAGTKPALPGEKLFEAQGIIALSCRNGEAHIDENMVVGSSLREGVKPSWFVALYVDYDQSRDPGSCEMHYAPMSDDVTFIQLTSLDGTSWAMNLGGESFAGLGSFDAKQDASDFALLLVNTGDKRVERGIPIKLNDNNIPAPPRELLKS